MSRFLNRVGFGGGQPARSLALFSSPASPVVGGSTPIALSVFGGTGPYAITLLTGTLPAGRLISGQTIVGTYATAATYSYVLRVTDSVGATADLALTEIVANVGGLLPVTPTIPFSAQWHVHSATVTMRPDTTFQGYIVPRTGYSSGGILVVTSFDNAAGAAIREGQLPSTNAAGFVAGTKVIKGLYFGVSGIPGGGLGGTGSYEVDVAQTVGSSSSPVTFTIPGEQVITLPAVSGDASWALTSEDGSGPALMTDEDGVRFLRFRDGVNVGAWLRNATRQHFDSHNIAVYAVVKPARSAGGTLFSLGTRTLGFNANGLGSTLLISNRQVGFWGNTADKVAPGAANANRMFVGQQKQVLTTAFATDDGLGGTDASPSNCRQRAYVNEQGVTSQVQAYDRDRDRAGFSVGTDSQFVQSNGRARSYFDLYSLAVHSEGQLGNKSQMDARIESTIASIMTANGIVPITKNLLIFGDSQIAFGVGGYDASWTDGSGWNIATMLKASPETRIMDYAVGGQGIGRMQAWLDQDSSGYYNEACAAAAGFMLGDGHDHFLVLMGLNDVVLWPSTNGSTLGGRQAAETAAHADDFFNSASYVATLTASCSNYALDASYTGLTGVLAYGSKLTGPGWTAGVSVAGGISGSSFNLTTFQVTAQTAETTTATLLSYTAVVAKLLARGFKGAWGVQPGPIGPAAARFRVRIMADAITAVGAQAGGPYAGKLRVFDTTIIGTGGKYPFGADYTSTDLNVFYTDFPHLTRVGKALLRSGGDTPANGIQYNVDMLLAA